MIVWYGTLITYYRWVVVFVAVVAMIVWLAGSGLSSYMLSEGRASLSMPIPAALVDRGNQPSARNAEARAMNGMGNDDGSPVRAIPQSIRIPYGNPTTQNAPEPTAPYSAPTWTCAQIAEEMVRQGASASVAVLGASVVMAESGGRSNAVNITPRERSYGPFQINLLVHRQYSPECAQSLACATAIARRLSRDWTSWTPWSAFNSGVYLGRCA